MIKIFYEVQTWFEKRKSILIRKVSYKLLLFLIRFIVPLYFKFTPSTVSGVNNNKRENEQPLIIISLTSFPPRMKNLWMVLETLFRQTKKPDKIILWLASSQFQTIERVDIKVRNMQSRGLEIRFCEDLKSHKKYFYAMQEYKNDIIITVDDDIFYPEDMVENLVEKFREFPNCIICNRAHRITFANGEINNYTDWDLLSKNILGPDDLLVATTGGGTLYPPNSINIEAFNIDAIKELCPNADDIWLKCMSHLKGTTTVKVRGVYSEVFTTSESSQSGLARYNVTDGENDIQLRKVINRYEINFLSSKG